MVYVYLVRQVLEVCGSTHDRILLGVLISGFGFIISMMSRGNDLDDTSLLEDPACKVISESGVSGFEPEH